MHTPDALRSLLDRWIRTMIVTADLGTQHAKPSPSGFLLAQDQKSPGACVYVADNPAKDFHAPRSLGWHTVRVRRPEGLHYMAADIPDARPEVTVPDLTELHAAIADWT